LPAEFSPNNGAAAFSPRLATPAYLGYSNAIGNNPNGVAASGT